MRIDTVAQLLLGGVFAVRVFDTNKPMWARVGFGLVAADALMEAYKGNAAQDATLAGGVSAGALAAAPGGALGQLSKPLKFQAHAVHSLKARVSKIHQQMISGTRDPKVYELARSVVSRQDGNGNWIAPEKNNRAEAEALFNEVRKRVRYTWDPTDYDAFQTPARTLEMHTGDCFVKGTKVLNDKHQLVPIESLRVGDRIWGHQKWSTVTNTWEKGTLKTWLVRLNNGSSMRLTKDHKVWVYQCKHKHTGDRSHNCQHRLDERELVRIRVAELKPGMVLTQPDRVDFGTEEFDPRRALIEGLYLSDGSHQSTRFDIAGQDGCPKEAQKREVQKLCSELGIPTRWARKQIVINDKSWTQERIAKMGARAPQKHALSVGLNEPAARELLRGILADSGRNTHGTGSTFTTTSRELWLQARVLLKMCGITASERYIIDHGGLGTNPIWRLGIRGAVREDGKAAKLLRVKEVIADDVEHECFDVETDDHFVWLPEADWTTSQCDDMTSLLGAMCRSIGLNVRSRVIQTKDADTWNHIYLLVNIDGKWLPLDASVNKPAFWEVPKEYVVAVEDFDVKE